MSVEEPIAIIGSGCRFPGASSSPSRLWDLLREPRDLSSKVPGDRFNADAFYHENGLNHGTSNTQKSYFLEEDVRCFDASFFNISANEAESIDPQQRILLESIYEALETAGQTLHGLEGSMTGVFCGLIYEDYASIMFRDLDALPRYTASGIARSIASNRASYFFDWHGPSVTLDTACSSSLVAVHLAVKALRDGECSMAIAAGTNIILAPNVYISESKLNMLSPTGHSRMWDGKADGYARGEGVASVVLKRLSDAIADRDPIECVIRASCINQDGRTTGITMPSRKSQAELIRSTYIKAGLDPCNPLQRCQYFEAHGTGTQAGDPEEAAAIYSAFFSGDSTSSPEQDGLYVGSVKTVIGHTEATAGLAGLIKASLCVQHGAIPPNLHLDSLSSKIAPFAHRLQVPRQMEEWPDLCPGSPRRASVNSFGFGGTNAHVILESYEQTPNYHAIAAPGHGDCNTPVILPLVFSATSEKTLGAVLESYADFIMTHDKLDLNNLAWSLLCRRSNFPYKWITYASSVEALQSQLSRELEVRKSQTPSTIISRPSAGRSRIMGVFTGQGAQWPAMSLDLILKSPEARRWVGELQASLDQLPAAYRPDFSLLEELCRPATSSRVQQAAISQPLCTAVQIVFVNVLQALGITFDAVAGHSSGEIAAAYAVGILTASEAIRIAHLRGRFARLAGVAGKPGAMLAATLSREQADAFCMRPEFHGRLGVAAVNSSSSVTLSGDADAVQEAEGLLKGDGKFARVLRVDTAYHSKHMAPCAEPYLQALKACDIRPLAPVSRRWFSSVHHGQEITSGNLDELKAQYWVDNMCGSVLFGPAMTEAVSTSGPFDMILEVGPHPALKGPAVQTICAAEGSSREPPPYVGLLSRGDNAIETVAAAIASVWSYLGPNSCNVDSYAQLFERSLRFGFVKDLPTYPFNHSNRFWAEPRVSRSLLHQKEAPNQILGRLCADAGAGEWRWRNYLRREEIQWLSDHCIQAQEVYPAAGYIAMAFEAAQIMTQGRQTQLVEVQDFRIETALPISGTSAGIEILFALEKVLHLDSDCMSTSFACHADIGGVLRPCASGKLRVTVGTADHDLLAPRSLSTRRMHSVDVDEYYSYLTGLGYGYSGVFRGITSLERRGNAACGRMLDAGADKTSTLALHPAFMECLLQALLASVGAPGDGQLYTLHIPTGIGRIVMNASLFGVRSPRAAKELVFDASVTDHAPNGIIGDAGLFDSNGRGLMQMEGVCVSPLTTVNAMQDRLLFSETVWGPLHPDASVPYYKHEKAPQEQSELLERIALFYLKNVSQQLTATDRARFDSHRLRFATWVDHVLGLTESALHRSCRRAWLNDDASIVDRLLQQPQLVSTIDKKIIQVVGSNLLRFFRFETTMLEELRKDGLLDELYRTSADFAPYNMHVGHVAGQIAFRFPRMKILEIGAGTGSATRAVVDEINTSYHSYTFTDISAGFFSEAQRAFQDHADRFLYNVLDIEQSPHAQGFEEHSYDLVIASNVLHATKSLRNTMAHVRSLLKPGGYLLLMEGTNKDVIRISTIFGGFEGWWLADDGRQWGPMVDATQWDSLLTSVGFSQIQTITPDHSTSLRPFSIIVSQAVDDTINLLQSPLNASSLSIPKLDHLLLVGGEGQATTTLMSDLKSTLTPLFHRVSQHDTLEAVDFSAVTDATTVVNTADLDRPFFEHLTDQSWSSLKLLTQMADRMLWISGSGPFQGMSKGYLRSLTYQNPGQHYQHLQIDASESTAKVSSIISTALMQLAHVDFDNDYTLARYVWSVEHELLLKDGILNIPRIMNKSSANERYVASRRPIYNKLDPRESCLHLVNTDYNVDLICRRIEDKAIESCTRIRAEYSTCTAVRVGAFGYLHVVIGRDTNNGARLLGLSEQHASFISTPSLLTLPCDVPGDVAASCLLSASVECLVAVDLVSRARPHSTILLHEASEILKRAVSRLAPDRDISPIFSTVEPAVASSDTILFHEMSTGRALKSQLPQNLSMIVQMSASSNSFFARLRSLVAQDVLKEHMDSCYRPLSVTYLHASPETGTAGNLLRVAGELALELVSARQVDTLDIQSLPCVPVQSDGARIVDWTSTDAIHARVRPASSDMCLLPDKTYLVINLPDATSRSVCEWMVSKGAGTIAIAAQDPIDVDEIWVGQMLTAGATVIAMTIDWSKATPLQNLHRTVCETLPPVAGVISGTALPTDDSSTAMGMDKMQGTLDQSVQSILQLDEAFSSNTLDFFILFGSAVGSIGHPGQASHSTLTAFMSSIIERRRIRGLAGSIIHTGEIRGIGCNNSFAGSDDSMCWLPMSERDLGESLAEAILAASMSTSCNPEIIAGLGHISPQQQQGVPWVQAPSLWHFILPQTNGISRQSIDHGEAAELQLESASNLEEAGEIVERMLVSEIRQRLQVSSDEVITRSTLMVELGVDSLVAIDLRTWFSNELSVDIPTLKLLGGASIGDLTDHATANSALLTGLQHEQPKGTVDKDGDPALDTGSPISSPVSTVQTTPSTGLSDPSSDTSPASSQSDSDSLSDNNNKSTKNNKNEKTMVYTKVQRLSFAQTRYWFLNQFHEDKTSHNVTLLFKMATAPQVADLENAIRHVGMRHETLRTCYLTETDEGKNPYQAILERSPLQLETCRVGDAEDVMSQVASIRNHIYNLENGEVARIRLITTAANTSFLIMGWHHMALDAASFHIFLGELGLAYSKRSLPRVPRQYTDFGTAQRAAYEKGEMDVELTYWKTEFENIPDPLPLLPMASARVRQALKGYDLHDIRLDVGPSTMRMIKASCKKHRASPFHFFLAVLRIFLARLTGVDDICIGVAESNRFDAANAGIVGFLLNLLPLRFQASIEHQLFSEVLTGTRDKTYKALQNSNVPFDKLLDELGAARSTAYSPLFQVLMDWQPQTGDNYKLGDIDMVAEKIQPAQTAYDLTLLIGESSDGSAIINFRVQSSLYDRKGADLIARGFMDLVEVLAADFSQPVDEAPMYQSEVEHAIKLGKGPTLARAWPETISRRIDDIADKYPDRIAVKDTEDRVFTYKGLAGRTTVLAATLLELSIAPGSSVCLFMQPTADWVCCMLAIWKVGLVYVPLDLRNPVARLASMVQDCQPRVIVCQDDTAAEVEALGFPAANVLNISHQNSKTDISAVIQNKSEPQGRCTILYTSGTTGRPKGIQLRNSSLRNEVEGYTTRWRLGAETVLQQGAMTFNHSLDQMLVGLCNGGRVVVVSRSLRGDPVSLTKLIVDEKITYTKATPSEYSTWLQYGSDSLSRASSWTFAFGGGEHFTSSLSQRFRALELPQLRLFNSYGPGEITISSHKSEIDYRDEGSAPPGNIYPVGESLPNYSVYIVDKKMRSVPRGVSGEILIGGAGPCMGYLNMDALNEEKFIRNPFASPEYISQGWTRAYRTFDRGHLLSDGSLVIEGRLDGDTQVKLRGIRIELGDIESTILEVANGLLDRVVVSARGDKHRFLAAHVVFTSQFDGDVDQLLHQLKTRLPLPQYMCPAVFVPVDTLPLNIHGKFDRRAVESLPLPKAANNSSFTNADGTLLTPAESAMRDLWSKVLNDEGFVNISDIDSETDFFMVGGSSVLLVKLQAMLREGFEAVVQLVELFENSTLGAMAVTAEAARRTNAIDWEAETSIDDILAAQLQLPPAASPSTYAKRSGITVVLTGVTGVLGREILQLLVADQKVAHIHAVAVRSRVGSKRTLPAPSPKLELHDGDLCSPQLGLDAAVFALLAATADVVIHNGANRSVWDEYQVVREANVASTKTLISLALASDRRIPIHFISSGGLASMAMEGSTPTSTGKEGYLASRWASEQLLQRAAAEFGIPSVAHRPAHRILKPTSPQVVLDKCRSIARQMRCLPTKGGWEGTLTFTPTRVLAEDVVARVLGSLGAGVVDASGKVPATCAELAIHEHCATVQVEIADIINAARETGEAIDDYDTLIFPYWHGRARREFELGWFATGHDVVVGEGEMKRASVF
ncbi:putative hybrid PKS-NRPS biosynthetic cluster [Aspergillus puulaauensis]|uniref:Putative hybrid PKS-NRPS biosynthetic cluster n=1 Tax=Aspergillus puulaauensis TaxID=1220207 RepID=A0A7R7XXV7_9EURO|nr:putative hybrid PKS-NRPS biosynthetic cluster [Aspergillus puulaauensis]BCS29676.1 putative hybrid PKS-NRPS biosynthetic cluster [Aspergillus puulaauensis]